MPRSLPQPDTDDVGLDELSIDQLAMRSAVPVRTIREYQAIGLVPAPERRGRVGVYRRSHLARLQLIGRLQQRGYSLAGIRDLLASWRDGADLGEVLGLEPDELVHIDEPGRRVSEDQLVALVPTLVPARLQDLLATGVVEACGPEQYCVPSPSLLQLAVDALAAGFDVDRVLALLDAVGRAAADVADAVVATLSAAPATRRTEAERLATRGRGLLAHGTGRLAIHALGRRLGITDDHDAPAVIRKALRLDES